MAPLKVTTPSKIKYVRVCMIHILIEKKRRSMPNFLPISMRKKRNVYAEKPA